MTGDWRDAVLLLIGHFLWQGTVVGLVTWLILRRTRSAKDRAGVLLGALFAMLLAPGITYGATLLTGSHEPAILRVGGELPLIRPFAWLWLLGVGLNATRFMGGWFRLRSLLARNAHPASAALRDQAAKVASALGFRRQMEVLETDLEIGPATYGILKHVLIVPASVVARLTPDQMEAILAHEIAHMMRNDFLIGLLVGLAESMLFFHPAVWWLSAQIRKEREHCCDQIALGFVGSPARYATALLGLAEKNDLAPSMAATGGKLTERVRKLRAEGTPGPSRRMKLALLVPALAVLLPAGLAPVPGKSTHAVSAIDAVPAQPIVVLGEQALSLTPTGPVTITVEGKQVPKVKTGQFRVVRVIRIEKKADPGPTGYVMLASNTWEIQLPDKRDVVFKAVPKKSSDTAPNGEFR